MTILCIFCKPKRPPWTARGKSRVLASRRVHGRTLDNKGNRTHTKTMERYRECLGCGYRWNTVEIKI
jgi:transcriptional regulator NrdR family protein